MKTMITKSVDLKEDFIQDLQYNQIEIKRAEVRIYDDIRIAIEIYVKCIGFGYSDFDILDHWGLHGAIICGVGHERLSIYHGDVTSDMLEKIIKAGGE